MRDQSIKGLSKSGWQAQPWSSFGVSDIMDANSAKTPFKPLGSWGLTILILALIIGLFVAITIPNSVGGGPGRFSGILYHLRQIGVAKAQWAWEHGLTKATQPSRVITATDLAPYLGRVFNQSDLTNGKYGELYLIRDLNQPAEAVLTANFSERDGSWSLSRGTIIRLDQEPGSDGWEFISPDGTSIIYRWMHGTLTMTNR